MNNIGLREEARQYFLPILLGNGREAHRLSMTLFRRFGIVSYVVSPKRSVRDLWDISSRYLPLIPSADELVCGQLIHIATQSPYTLPLLIPMTPEYSALADKHRGTLESYFVICDAATIFESSPLAMLK